jgi:murein L,D-transpeptidase YcbB/YkuD
MVSLLCVLSFALAAAPEGRGAASAASGAPAVAGVLRGILEGSRDSSGLWIGCERIHADRPLTDFYRRRDYQPAWLGSHDTSLLFAAMVRELRNAGRHGLTPEEYHLPCLETAADRFQGDREVGRASDPNDLAEQDIILSDAFVTFASHLAGGKVDPEKLHPLWVAHGREREVFEVFGRLLATGDLEGAVRGLAPPAPEYWRMVDALAWCRGLEEAGGWEALDFERDLQNGMRDPHVPALRRNLAAHGDLTAGDAADDRFDATLEAALRRFQARHGLATDGVVGPETRREMSVSAAARRRQIEVNLERMRWLPHAWEDRYLVVDTADFSLAAFERGAEELHMRVVVGEAYTKTPVFSDVMEYLEVNPYWNIPDGIAAREILPRIQRDAGYLARQRIELLSGWEASARAVDPATVLWQQVTGESFPGRLRQLPGPGNTLGRIKFMFPNRFHVYLHDTPARDLFLRHQRALSHGCIRVEAPLDLALFVLQDDPRYTREYLEGLIASGERHVILLPAPTAVHLLYRTAWVDPDGVVHFRRDIYERDQVVWAALRGVPRGEAVTHREPTGSGFPEEGRVERGGYQ